MEHLRPNGEIFPGWYCANCGKPTGMLGHFDFLKDRFSCRKNWKLVNELEEINKDFKARD